jgi:hypothetical protein
MIESKFRLQESYQQNGTPPYEVAHSLDPSLYRWGLPFGPAKIFVSLGNAGTRAAWLGCSGFFVKPRARLLLPNMLIFARYILAGIFSH